MAQPATHTTSHSVAVTPLGNASLRDYLELLNRRRWWVVSLSVVVFATALVVSMTQTPIYESEAQVLLKESGTTSTDTLTGGPNLETERQIAVSDAVAAIAAKKLGEEQTGLLSGLSVEVATNTEILIFRYSHPGPEVAQQRAQAFADAYLEYTRREVLRDLLAASRTVTEQIDKLRSQLDKINARLAKSTDEAQRASLTSRSTSLIGQISVLEQELADLSPPGRLRVGQMVGQPDVPAAPVAPNHFRNGLLGLVGGLVLSVVAALFLEILDDRLRGRDDLEMLARAPVLAAIPRVAGWRRKDGPKLIALDEPAAAATEAYRKLRTGLLFIAKQTNCTTIMVTSPQADEGKTATTANLGVVMAQAGKKVALVSADLRKPRLHRFFGLENFIGVTSVLGGEVSPWQAVRATATDHLQVLVSGPVPANPAELLGSDAMGRLLSALGEVADYVIVDAPPIMAVADPVTITPLVDGVLFVVDAQNTGRGIIDQARRQLDQVNGRVIGAVLNNFDPTKAGGYYYGNVYRYEAAPEWGDGAQQPRRLPWRSARRG
jgi:capsular exopolysaccharide synthesis family protein